MVNNASQLLPSPCWKGARSARLPYCCRKSESLFPTGAGFASPLTPSIMVEVMMLSPETSTAAPGITSESQGAPGESPLLINVSNF